MKTVSVFLYVCVEGSFDMLKWLRSITLLAPDKLLQPPTFAQTRELVDI